MADKLAAVYRKRYEPIQGNKILDYHENGNSEFVSEYEKINITYTGKNSLLVIHEPIKILSKVNISLNENCFVEIFEHVRIFSMVIAFPAPNSTLVIHKKTTFEANAVFSTATSPNLEIIIGEDCMIAPNVTFRACDGHAIFSIHEKSNFINESMFGIHVGNHCWIAAGADILKDVEIPDDCIVGRRALVTSKSFEEHSIIAGIPAKTIKKDVSWNRLDVDFLRKHPLS